MRIALCRHIASAFALSAVAGSLAFAQGRAGAGSDHTGPGGSGAGLSGMLGFTKPPTLGTGAAINAAVGDQLALRITSLAGTPADGMTVPNPATGTNVVVPQSIVLALADVLRGNGTGAGASTLEGALTAGGVPAGLANALVAALAALGNSPTLGTLQAAVVAYNNAVNGSTGPVPPALLAVRAALSGIIEGIRP